MTISEPLQIDIIGISKDRTAVVMVISDHLDWSDEHAYLQQLQDKLNGYLEYIESGQLLSERPDAAGMSIVIDVYALYEPTPAGLEFYELARDALLTATAWCCGRLLIRPAPRRSTAHDRVLRSKPLNTHAAQPDVARTDSPRARPP